MHWHYPSGNNAAHGGIQGVKKSTQKNTQPITGANRGKWCQRYATGSIAAQDYVTSNRMIRVGANADEITGIWQL